MKSGKPFLGSITFLHCTENTLLKVKADWFHVLFIYRDLELKGPQPIPDREMNNFRMVMNLQGQEIIPLVVHNREFLEGQKVRVLDGPFKGAEGVIKRIKGDRRLIVSIAGVAAVATSFIHPDYLGKIDQ